MTPDEVRVLLVEDDPADVRLLQEALADAGISRLELLHVERLGQALERLGKERIDAVLLDLGLPDSRGLDTFQATHDRAPGVPIIVLTGLDDETAAVKAVQQGAQDYLLKWEVDGRLLVRALRYAIERQRLLAHLLDTVTERQRKEQQASMGQLAAFVVHQINTPLTNIALLTASAARQVTDPSVLEKIEKINAQRRLAANIIAELMRFVRLREMNPVETDVRSIIEAALDQVAVFQKPGVALEKHLPASPVIARVDPLKLQEVVVNLTKNALQATSAGSVKVSLEQDPSRVSIVVMDTGSGMPQEVIRNLFTPGFTTKKQEEGTGLGLAFCRTITQAHGGTIEVSSDHGKGSTFKVSIPARIQ